MISSSDDPICLQCNSAIDSHAFHHSIKKYKFPLCEDCQIWFIGKVFYTPFETIQLYFALKSRGVPARLEKHDKYKKVDIAINESNVHIEIDITHHHYNHDQTLHDLKKAQYDHIDGNMTLKIPNSLVRHNIDQTSELIKNIVLENKRQHTGKDQMKNIH